MFDVQGAGAAGGASRPWEKAMLEEKARRSAVVFIQINGLEKGEIFGLSFDGIVGCESAFSIFTAYCIYL
jgi:hypothetical protein